MYTTIIKIIGVHKFSTNIKIPKVIEVMKFEYLYFNFFIVFINFSLLIVEMLGFSYIIYSKYLIYNFDIFFLSIIDTILKTQP